MVAIPNFYHQPLIPLLWCFGAGILIGEQFYIHRCLSGLVIAGCAARLTFHIIRRKSTALAPLLLFFCLGWFAITGFVHPVFPPDHITGFTGSTPWTITGAIISDPVEEPGSRHFYLKPVRLARGDDDIAVSGNLRVKVYGDGPVLSRGTVIRFNSRIREISNFKNPGGFDYRRYLAFKQVFGLAYSRADRITVLDLPVTRNPVDIIETARDRLAAHIDHSTDGIAAGILKALIVGKKNDLDPSVKKLFNRIGVGHLLAISGLHVGIIAAISFNLLVPLLSFISALTRRGWVKKTAALITLAVIIAYGLIAGMAPSTQRAVIMVAVFMLAFVAEKRPSLMNTLALAALIILSAHPPSLFSISFQLSFAAVFFIIQGMAAVGPLVNRIPQDWIFQRLVKRGLLFLLVSSFAIIGTSPLTMHYFNQASLVGLAANCLMIPLIGFVAVPVGLCGALAHGISADLSLLFFKIGATVIEQALIPARAMSLPSRAAISTVTPSPLEIACCYMLLWSLLTLFKNGRPEPSARKQAGRPAESSHRPNRTALLAAVISALVLITDIGYWTYQRWLHTDLRITVLDVGQGNAALLEIPGGRRVLIDGGGFTGSSTFDVGEMIVARFLRRNKIGTVETIILTHPDTDHLSGLRYIARHFNVKTVWSNNEPVNTEHYREFMEIVREKEITMPAFDRLERTHRMNGVRFDILYPPLDFLEKKGIRSWRNPNNNSLVVKITYGEVSFLFPGDIMRQAEFELVALAGDRLAATVLVAPHHGSRTSSTSLFVNRVWPEAVVVSAGRLNRYGYPHADVLKRYEAVGATVYVTGRDGAVEMTTRGAKLHTRTPSTRQKARF